MGQYGSDETRNLFSWSLGLVPEYVRVIISLTTRSIRFDF